ncbi:MAG: DNA topoisomerase IV subunit B [Alphaproteobacteria bacterium]|nr:DNA topoisomerase IV subunit B [Alphaproteobacteria bacterium]
MDDLFQRAKNDNGRYTAEDIEVLEGLEPVRRRPGMYIGGTDERALHHLAAEVLDNAMDEAVAGFASRIEMELRGDGYLVIRDNGRGIPIDKHPKFKDKSALEVILTMLHSGGKFGGKVYDTSGGLHGVGISVVNALSDRLVVEVARDKKLWTFTCSRGKPQGKLKDTGSAGNRRGTSVTFHPDPDIFGAKIGFSPNRLYKMARAKAHLYRGVEIRWRCDPGLIKDADTTPAEDTIHFPGGLADYLQELAGTRPVAATSPFVGQAKLGDERGQVEWAVTWPKDGDDGHLESYVNTIPTPEGGTHEQGMRAAIVRGLKAYADLAGNRRAGAITAEDVLGGAVALLSLFIRDPQFQGQTKERLATTEASRLVENAIKDHFDHYLSGAPETANAILALVIERAEDRLRRRQEKEVARKTATRKQRLPGKLADCSREEAEGTEVFLVEGDSAGGSAKQARDRETQAVLPLRGKILNVASASVDKLRQNQELADLVQALGCGTGAAYRDDALRYERVVVMTDADVDGAHIASLLMTFFYREMPELIRNGHLHLAIPPLYRLSKGGKTIYARDDADKDKLMKEVFKGAGGVEISRFKGLGEMPAAQLKDTTMSPKNRTLLRVVIPDAKEEPTSDLVERLMGRKPELRLAFIQENAEKVVDLDV